MLLLRRFAVFGAATIMAASSFNVDAIPTIEAPPDWQAQRVQPPASGRSNCIGQPTAEDQQPIAAWNGKHDATPALDTWRTMDGDRKTDLDSYNSGRCRLIDASHHSQEPLNDGLDTEKLLKLLDELEASNRTFSEDEQQALLDGMGRNIYVQLDSTDNELHAYIGQGANRQDLGQLARLGLRYVEEDGQVVLHFDQGDRHYADTEIRLRNPLGGADPMGLAAAIPEPSTYAMLLAGLALLAWMRRRQGGA